MVEGGEETKVKSNERFERHLMLPACLPRLMLHTLPFHSSLRNSISQIKSETSNAPPCAGLLNRLPFLVVRATHFISYIAWDGRLVLVLVLLLLLLLLRQWPLALPGCLFQIIVLRCRKCRIRNPESGIQNPESRASRSRSEYSVFGRELSWEGEG
jgi:hypothetical protein